jgi:hypothetical protein
MGGARSTREGDEKFLSESLKARDHSEELSVGGRVIWECIWRNMVRNCGLDSSGSG